MNKKLLITTGIVAALILTGIFYVVSNKMMETPTPAPQPQAATTEPTKPNEPAVPAQDLPAAPTPGAYTDYNAEKVTTTQGTKILFFHAPWCPQCRALEADIKAGKIPDNVTIFKVNYDTAQELRQKYGVTLQTTLVKIDDAGNLVKKYVAYDEPTLAALIKNLL